MEEGNEGRERDEERGEDREERNHNEGHPGEASYGEDSGHEDSFLHGEDGGKDLNKKGNNTRLMILGLIIGLVVLGVILGSNYKMVGNVTNGGSGKVLLKTTLGDVIIELYEDMPITAGNFKSLVEKGVYDGVIFHRVIAGFMVQGGDPTGTGFGDPSIPSIEDEFVEGRSNLRGTLSMANSGPNSGSSQFFINLVDNVFLDFDKPPIQSKHPVFGKVVEGMDIVDKIGGVEVGVGDKPVEEVKIIKAEVL